MAERAVVTPESVPAWTRGVRLRFDEARDKWVIVSPENVSMPNETAAEILQLVDGARSATAISEALAQKFNAPKDLILKDVVATLQGLADKGMMTC